MAARTHDGKCEMFLRIGLYQPITCPLGVDQEPPSPARRAIRAASVRFETPSFANTEDRWLFTVFGDTSRRMAIAALGSPAWCLSVPIGAIFLGDLAHQIAITTLALLWASLSLTIVSESTGSRPVVATRS